MKPKNKKPKTPNAKKPSKRTPRASNATPSAAPKEVTTPAPTTSPSTTSTPSTTDSTSDAPTITFGALDGGAAVMSSSTFEAEVRAELDEITAMLVAKNEAYGDSALNPLRIFSRAGTVEQLRVRIDDKLSRIARGNDAGEDVEKDLIGYLVLSRIARRRSL